MYIYKVTQISNLFQFIRTFYDIRNDDVMVGVAVKQKSNYLKLKKTLGVCSVQDIKFHPFQLEYG